MADLKGVSPELAQRVQALLNAAGGKVGIMSGHRDTGMQQRLFDAAVKRYGSPQAARKWVALPGHSHHEKGLAVDFSGDLGLVRKLAPQFGLQQPMPWEAWHFELAGTPKNANAQTTAPDQAAVPETPDLATSYGMQLDRLFALVKGEES
jgi:LAS superfamily LD-carboxypeptidase LdcB